MKEIVTLGELLMRLSLPKGKNLSTVLDEPIKPLKRGNEWYNSGKLFEFDYGGSEANVAISLANFGAPVRYVTKISNDAASQTAKAFLKNHGLDLSYVKVGAGKLGMYQVEECSDPNKWKRTYYRKDSVFANCKPSEFDWDQIFKDAEWFHFSGITPALSPSTAQICLEACQKAQEKGLKISCDINYRSALWTMEEAQKVMQPLCQYADMLIINEEEAKVLGINLNSVALMEEQNFEEMVEALTAKYPNLKTIATVARIQNNTAVQAIMWSKGRAINRVSKSGIYPIKPVDFSGAGDAFAAAVIFCKNLAINPQQTIELAAASCALKHGFIGDCSPVRIFEVLPLIPSANA